MWILHLRRNQRAHRMIRERHPRPAGRSGERVWAMPMWEEYNKQLESKVADIKHVGGPQAGSITAAKFLEAFVNSTPWLHLDIAGTAYNVKSKKYLGDGASGYGVRLLWEVLDILQNLKRTP